MRTCSFLGLGSSTLRAGSSCESVRAVACNYPHSGATGLCGLPLPSYSTLRTQPRKSARQIAVRSRSPIVGCIPREGADFDEQAKVVLEDGLEKQASNYVREPTRSLVEQVRLDNVARKKSSRRHYGQDQRGRLTDGLLTRLAIFSRSNVRKSASFSHLARGDVAVVHDAPGVTADRFYTRETWSELKFSRVNTRCNLTASLSGAAGLDGVVTCGAGCIYNTAEALKGATTDFPVVEKAVEVVHPIILGKDDLGWNGSPDARSNYSDDDEEILLEEVLEKESAEFVQDFTHVFMRQICLGESNHLNLFRDISGPGLCVISSANEAAECHHYGGRTFYSGHSSLRRLSFGLHQISHGWKSRQRKKEVQFTSNIRNYDGQPSIQAIPGSKSRFRVAMAGSQSQALVQTKQVDAVIRKGALFEFERESGKVVLAVAQKPDGKKNWIAVDQGGNTYSVKPQQITYLIPGIENFSPADIVSFLVTVQDLEDMDLLEVAWEELSSQKVVLGEDLAQVLFSQGTPAECYTVHRMLSTNQTYFRCKQQGPTPVYEPRPLSQVTELLQKKMADEKAHAQLLSYVAAVKSALHCPQSEKPAESTWYGDTFYQTRTEALKSYVLGVKKDPAQKKCAEQVIETLGVTKNPFVALNLLIGMGVFPKHVNIDLLRLKDQLEFKEIHHAAVEQVLNSSQPDLDREIRKDLTSLKVYTIDSEDTDEIDDGLSATRLSDGRIKVWIHVADPTRWLPHDHVLTREAEIRGTSIYLPTGTIPMFPMDLAAGVMSLKQGCDCCAISVSVVLREDGSLEDYEVVNSRIIPTYKLSYDNVMEMLLMDVQEEPELYLLAEVATLRARWRSSQGALLSYVPETEIKVTDSDSPEPAIALHVKDQSTPAMQLVAEMMILCGEAIACFGEENRLSLPYRGQAQNDFSTRELSNIPEGPGKTFAVRRLLGAVDMSSTRPVSHASLGLSGYVQFTSPIRRYGDLVAHYQVKALLRGDSPPYTSGTVEAKMTMTNIRSKDARKLQASAVRYWTIVYLQRQPNDRKYEGVVLRYQRDREASVLLTEVGFRGNVLMASSLPIGSVVSLIVTEADPRKDVLHLRHL